MNRIHAAFLCGLLVLGSGTAARAERLNKFFILNVPTPNFLGDSLDGLNVRAEFELDTAAGKTLVIRLFNHSTILPLWFDNADQLVTAISFDFGAPGPQASDPKIISGSVVVGMSSQSISFDHVSMQLGPGDDVSGEWGFGNGGREARHLQNFVTTTADSATAFSGTNLDGPEELDGPQGGLATDPPILNTDGVGAISDSVLIRVELDSPLFDLDFLNNNGVLAEFGENSAYVTIPEPASLSLLALCAFGVLRRRRSR